MIARDKHLSGVAPGQHRANGHAPAETLCQCEDVRQNAKMLVRKQPACAADARLHLVDDEEEVTVRAHPPDAPEVLRRRHVDPPLTLHRFQHHRADIRCDGILQGAQVVERHGNETRGKRFKSSLIRWLGGRRKRSQGASMEGMLGDDNLKASVAAGPPPLSRQLDCRLVRLCPAVAEKRAGQSGVVHEPPGQLSLLRNLVEVADVQQARGLPPDRGGHRGVVVSQDGHGDAGDEIEVGLSFQVHQPRPLPRGERDRRPAVRPHQVPLTHLSDTLRIHHILPSELQTDVYLVYLVFLVYLVCLPLRGSVRVNLADQVDQVD